MTTIAKSRTYFSSEENNHCSSLVIGCHVFRYFKKARFGFPISCLSPQNDLLFKKRIVKGMWIQLTITYTYIIMFYNFCTNHKSVWKCNANVQTHTHINIYTLGVQCLEIGHWKPDLVNIQKLKHEQSPVRKGVFSCFTFFLHVSRPSPMCVLVLCLGFKSSRVYIEGTHNVIAHFSSVYRRVISL